MPAVRLTRLQTVGRTSANKADQSTIRPPKQQSGSDRRRQPSSMPQRTDPLGSINTRSISEALAGSDALASLTARVQASRARLAAIQDLLPTPMRSQVRPGPIDEEGFSLLASSQAVAAKLRNMRPALEAHLVKQGFSALPIRVKVVTPG